MPEDLKNPQLHAMRAALGWLELGLPREALTELDDLPSEAQHNADVLEVRWMILANLKDWDLAVRVSRELTQTAPDRAASWLHHAYAVRRASEGGVLAAFNILVPVASRFSKEPTIPYNIACYTCQLGRGDAETLEWFERALAIGDPKELISMALEDDDLVSVRSLIEKLPAARLRRG